MIECPRCGSVFDPEEDGTPPTAHASHFRTYRVPVVDGVATLPDGRTIRSQAQVVEVHEPVAGE